MDNLYHQFNYYSNGDIVTRLRNELISTSWKIRRYSIPLIDAFNLPDFVLKSPFGRYDGNVYEHYFSDVKNNPNASVKAPYWNDLISPILHYHDNDYDANHRSS